MSNALPCPKCGNMKTQTTDSRAHPNGVKRRRVCTKCGERFSTMERPITNQMARGLPPTLLRAAHKYVLNKQAQRLEKQ